MLKHIRYVLTKMQTVAEVQITLIRSIQPCYKIQQRGFAASCCTYECDKLALLDEKIHIFQRPDFRAGFRTKSFGYTAKLQCC